MIERTTTDALLPVHDWNLGRLYLYVMFIIRSCYVRAYVKIVLDAPLAVCAILCHIRLWSPMYRLLIRKSCAAITTDGFVCAIYLDKEKKEQER
jgi:hypothetical protein